jgi:hypothetical protein
MTHSPGESVLRLRRVESMTVDGEVVVLDLAQSEYYGINGSGTPLWHALQEGATAAELAGILMTTYSLSAEVAESDAAEFVNALRARGLLDETSR